MKHVPATLASVLLIFVSMVTGIQDGRNSSLQEDIRRQEQADREAGNTVSRRKRFLVFPDGSSLQLVFCCQTAAIIHIGDIFLYGNTAALAWQLPQDPSLFHMLKDKNGSLLRRKDDPKNIYYTDDKGKLLYKEPYRKRPIVNPAFAKRSVDPFQIQNSQRQDESSAPEAHAPEAAPLDRKQMHAAQRRRDFLNIEHMGEKTVEFHRHSRKGLYEKLEVFLKALGVNGRECVRRVLCETGSLRADEPQGSFMQEMMRAVFTLPRGREFEKENHREYDAAHAAAAQDTAALDSASQNSAAPDEIDACEKLYPDCEATGADIPLFA